MPRSPAVAGFALLALMGGPAAAEGGGPVYKDLERFGTVDPGGRIPEGNDAVVVGRRGPPRRVTGGPGYVGSEYGLGKPAFTGLGSRPDWGHSE